MKKHISPKVFSLFVVFLLLSACSTNPTTNQNGDESGSQTDLEDQAKVSVVLMALNTQYFKFIEAGARAAFEDFGVDGSILAPSNQTQVMEQVNMIEDALNQGTEALVVTPSQPDSTIPILTRYGEANIPVVLLDSDVDWDGKTTFIGTDNFEAGRTAGEMLASLVNEGDNVAILEGIAGTPTSEVRVNGAKTAIEDAGLNLVASQTANWDRVQAVNVMEDILQVHPNIKGVFAANDEMALGALRALQLKGLDIPVIGVDGIIEAVESITEGNLSVSVAQKPFEMGYIGVEQALKAIKGEEVKKRIDSGLEIITKENGEEILASLKLKLGEE